MDYIIIWRNSHREPFPCTDSHGFMETFSSFEQAKEHADETLEAEGPKSEWYFDYKIYQQKED